MKFGFKEFVAVTIDDDHETRIAASSTLRWHDNRCETNLTPLQQETTMNIEVTPVPCGMSHLVCCLPNLASCHTDTSVQFNLVQTKWWWCWWWWCGRCARLQLIACSVTFRCKCSSSGRQANPTTELVATSIQALLLFLLLFSASKYF